MIAERYRGLKVDAAGIGVCVIASLVFYWTTVQPFLQRQRAAAGQRQELKVRQDKARELKDAVSKAQERLAAAQTERAAGAIGLEPAAHVNKRLAALTQLFSGRSLEVDDVQTGRVSAGTRYTLVPITITGRGAYASFVGFFGELRLVFPDMSVARIELAGQPGQTAASVTFQFDLLWYAAPDRSAAGPAVMDGRQYVLLGW